MTLVDTNVLLDVLSSDSAWFAWSLQNLARRSIEGPLLINDVVYAEMAARMETAAVLADALAELQVQLQRIPLEALFVAGKTFLRYRRTGGVRTGVLPDFFIGAHAQVAGLPILTRDTRRYRAYFPDVELIAPNG